MKNQKLYNISVSVTTKEGEKRFSYDSNTFSKGKFDALIKFLLSDDYDENEED